jgi:hypothetical protein
MLQEAAPVGYSDRGAFLFYVFFEELCGLLIYLQRSSASLLSGKVNFPLG